MAAGSTQEGGSGATGPQRRVLHTALEDLDLGDDDRDVIDRLVEAKLDVARAVADWVATARARPPPEHHDHVFALGWAPGCEHDMEVAVVDLDAAADEPAGQGRGAPPRRGGSGRGSSQRHRSNRAHRTLLRAVLVGLVAEPDEADLEAFAWLADRRCEVVDAVAAWITATRELPRRTGGELPAGR